MNSMKSGPTQPYVGPQPTFRVKLRITHLHVEYPFGDGLIRWTADEARTILRNNPGAYTANLLRAHLRALELTL